MCRFIAYLGAPLLLDDVLYKPKNSLINQSFKAQEMEEPLNGDGFGIGWYVPQINSVPGLFRSVRPAWNDMNLIYLAKKIMSPCFLAHIRASSFGAVELDNCHPFHYGDFLFMHNGDIGGFSKIKRYMRRQLSDEIYEWVKGGTDSEHFFALFIDKLTKQDLEFNPKNVSILLPETIKQVESIQQLHDIDEPIYLNAVITNGKFIIALRYVSQPHLNPSSMHFAVGEHFQAHNHNCHIKPTVNGKNKMVLITSETLNNFSEEWHQVPKNSMMLVDEDLTISFQEIS